MSLTAAVIRRMSEMGLSGGDIAELAEMIEEGFAKPVPELSRAALRTRKWREKKDEKRHGDVTVTHHGDAETPFLPPLSPEPPNPSNLSSKPPYSPPTSAERKPVADATAELFEEAWKACTEQMRKRSASKDQTQKFWLRSARKANGETQLLGALKRYLRDDPDVGRTGGPGFHIWLRDGKWEQHLPRPEPPAKPADAAVIAHRIQHFRDTGEWKPAWGDPPQERAA